MEMTFDIRGNLYPAQRIELDFEKFREIFVKSFDVNSTRHEIFENYQTYIKDFQTEISPNFHHWINGSFATNKKNPRDIDFVVTLEHDVFEEKRETIYKKFRLRGAKEIYKLDAYTVELFPEGHRQYLNCKSDLVYWDNWFGKTKKNRANKSFPKGYIEIKFG